MRFVISWLFFVLSLCFADTQSERIVYVRNATPTEILEKPIYVGQTIPITYNVLLFNDSTFTQGSFTDKIATDKIILKNPKQSWKEIENGQYQITYYFKIKATNAIIPPFEVIASSQDDSYTNSSTTDSIRLNIIDLYQNKKYAGVVADTLHLGVYKTKNYDAQSNLLAFEIIADNANLEDFKVPNIEKQGIERSDFNTRTSSAIFYCIVPRNIQNISFEYFSLINNRFEEVTIPVIPEADTVGTQENLKPKNTYLIYTALFICGVMATLILLSFFFKRLRKVLWFLSFIIFVYLLYYLFYTQKETLEAGKHIWILPTHNSTLLETTKQPIEVKVIGKRDQYYKIITPDEKIGWIRKEDVK